MTLAVSIKVHDGIVLATDSALTASGVISGIPKVLNVYENGNKIIHLHKKFPVGIMLYGNSSFGKSSITTLIKDFRQLIMSESDLHINDSNYSVRHISEKFRDYINQIRIDTNTLGLTGFRVSGYNIDGTSEEFDIKVSETINSLDMSTGNEDSGIAWFGMPEVMFRLVKGYSLSLISELESANIDPAVISKISKEVLPKLEFSLHTDVMPIMDAVQVAKFFIETTSQYTKMANGIDNSVGGPIEVAVITKHEGFKWVQRKHYFQSELNPS